MDTSTVILSVLSLLAGVFGKEAWAYFAGKRKNNADAHGSELGNYDKLKKLIEDGIAKDAQKSEENARLKMTNDVLSGTIETNNKFMATVLMSHGEMKKSNEILQQRILELEKGEDQYRKRITELEKQVEELKIHRSDGN